jgi:abortive infection bacteriophage resistance protein
LALTARVLDVKIQSTIPARPLNDAQIGGLLICMQFRKPAKTYREQLEILKSRGLIVINEKYALHCLEHHNYYRISAYRFPFLSSSTTDQFINGATFEDVWALYLFDQIMRQLVSEALMKIEISVRARWAYVLGHQYGPHAYEMDSVFKNPQRHTSALAKLDEELNRSDEIFVKHYREKYQIGRPPIWAACEVMSFGLLSRFYENIKESHLKKQISLVYGLSVHGLKSFLEHAVYIRNLCAHHSRLWNRRFTVTVELPYHIPEKVVSSLHRHEPRRLYNTLVLIGHVIKVIDYSSDWCSRVAAHIKTMPSNLVPHMGFPADWEERAIWKFSGLS